MSMAADARAEFDPKEIARAAFPTAFRGYDQDAVRRYLSRLATAISRAQQLGLLKPVDGEHRSHGREAELELEASELQARVDELEDLLQSQPNLARSVRGPLVDRDLDEAELIELLGHETARILEQARSAGADIVHRAEAEAEAVKEQSELDGRTTLEEADALITSSRTEAEETRAAAAAEATRSQARNKAETKRAREVAKSKADEIVIEAAIKAEDDLTAAGAQADQTVLEAEQLRKELLSDLVRRRRIYEDQLDRMTTARDRLSQALGTARKELEAVSDDIDLAVPSSAELDLINDSDELSGRDDLSENDEAEIDELVAQLRTKSPVRAAAALDVDSAAFVERLLGSDAEGNTDVVIAGEDTGRSIDLDDEDRLTDTLKIEYLHLDAEESVDPEGVELANVELSRSSAGEGADMEGSTETLIPDDFDPEILIEHSNGVPNGSSPVVGRSQGDAALDLDVVLGGIDDLDFGRPPVLGASSGSLHRAASRGDLPRHSPFGGTLPTAFEGRDVAMARATPGFRRQLKRAVNDDQSLVLDRLRAGRGVIKVDELPAKDEQLDGYLEALQPILLEMVKQGSQLLNDSDVPVEGVDNLCLQLGRHIVDCLRRPTIEAIESSPDNDREVILDPVRATYRDFRNTLLPDLIDDALHEAFALGLFAAIDSDDQVLWLTDPRLDPDPICEENSAAPPLLKGTTFPSGHARPLSMPGCRCLVMPPH